MHAYNLAELARLNNGNLALRLAILGANGLKRLEEVKTLDYLTEDSVLTIKPGGFSKAEKELGSICVGSGICHRKHTRSIVLELKVLVAEGLTVDGAATSAIVACEITTLGHEARNNAVKARVFEAKPLLTSAQATEVLSSLWANIGPQLNLYTSSVLASDLNVHKHDGETHGSLKILRPLIQRKQV